MGVRLSFMDTGAYAYLIQMFETQVGGNVAGMAFDMILDHNSIFVIWILGHIRSIVYFWLKNNHRHSHTGTKCSKVILAVVVVVVVVLG